MARIAIVLAILAVLAVSAFAQPDIHDITNAQSPKLSLSYVSGNGKQSTRTNTQLYYGRVNLPTNAYAVNINATVTDTGGTCTSHFSTATAAPETLSVYVGTTMPCSYTFSYLFSGVSSGPRVICYSYSSYGYTLATQDYYLGYSYATVGFSVVNDYPYYWDAYTSSSPTSYINGAILNIVPSTSDLWLAVGRYDDVLPYVSCDFTLQATVYTCPGDQLAFSSTGGSSGGGVVGQETCVSYTNISLADSNIGNGSYVTGTGSSSASGTEMYKIWNVPMGTAYIWVNVSAPSSASSGSYLGVYGAAHIPSSYSSSSYADGFTCYGDTYYSDSHSYSPDNGATTWYTYSTACFAPNWNQTYYAAVTFDAAYDHFVSIEAVVCPTGWSGPQCQSPLTQMTGSLSYSVTTGSDGYAHFYWDTPANQWNETVVIFKTSTSGYLQLRPHTYSNYWDYTQYIGNGYWYIVNPSDSQISVSGTTGIASTTVDRYRSVDTRWVLTYACSGSSSSCTDTINVNFTTSALTPANSASGLAPLSVVLLFALLAAFLF